MLEITDIAVEKLTQYMKENNVSSPVRVLVMQGGCSGASLGLALDAAKPSDATVTANDLTLLVAEDLLKQCGTITVDFLNAGTQSGFSIRSAVPLPNSGGCNSGSCGSGGCGC